MDSCRNHKFSNCFVHVGGFMSFFFKSYLVIVGIFSIVCGLYTIFFPNLESFFLPFGEIERNTSLATFVRTLAGIFVAGGYIMVRFIFSSSRVQLGTVLIYMVFCMLVGKLSGMFYEGLFQYDLIAFFIGLLTLIALTSLYRQRKNQINYDL